MGLLIYLLFAARGYKSQYDYVAAGRGDKSLAQYEQLLRASLDANPANGRTSMQLAAFLASQKKYEAAAQLQRSGMLTYRTVSSFEQSGSVQEKLGDAAAADVRQKFYFAARELYEKAERVHPGNVSALEHLLALSYKAGDDKLLDEYASKLSQAQANNLNGVYLRALSAERRGDYVTAVSLLQRISAAGEPTNNALYTPAGVTERLRQLSVSHNLSQ
jgi:tetratricopeptide (TPR) repeat protein